MIIYHNTSVVYPRYSVMDAIEGTIHWWSQGIAPAPPVPVAGLNSRNPFIVSVGRMMNRGGF